MATGLDRFFSALNEEMKQSKEQGDSSMEQKPNPNFEDYQAYLAEKERELREAIQSALKDLYIPQGAARVNIDINYIEAGEFGEFYKRLIIDKVNINVDVSF